MVHQALEECTNDQKDPQEDALSPVRDGFYNFGISGVLKSKGPELQVFLELVIDVAVNVLTH